MPLPVAHGLLGASIIAALHPRPTRKHFLPLLVGALAANAADLDFILVLAARSKAWHRGFSHSIAFAVFVCALLLLTLGARHLRVAIAYGLAFASHAFLDYVTTKEGGGTELLWPFSTERLIPGWWGLSEVPSRLPPSGILKAMAVEFALFTPPLLAALFLRRAAARRAGRADSAAGAL